MRAIRLLPAVLLTSVGVADAQTIRNCPDCVLGLYDDVAMTQTLGTIAAFVPKDIYLGIRLAPSEAGVSSIEFSVTGLAEFLITAVEPLTPAAVQLGSLPAPADTSATSTGTGGMVIGWQGCREGSQALVRIQLIALSAPTDRVLKVMHRFPPSNANYGLTGPAISTCDSPTYTPVRVTGGCFVLNHSGVPMNTLCPEPPPPTPPLGIYADANGTSGRLCVERSTSATYYLLGRVPNFDPPGLTGAEFRIEVSNPSGYLFTYTAPDGASAFGNPFDLSAADSTNAAGVSVLFPSCQPLDPSRRVGDRVNFGTITVFNLSGDSTALRVKQKSPPSDPGMPCPRFLSCDAPFFTPLCMGGATVISQSTLNGASCMLGAPTAPLNLTASFQGTSPETMLLQWQRPVTGAIQGYNVYRSQNQSQFVKISTTLVTGTDYTDSQPPGGALCYEVSAVDSLSREGPRSGAACPPPPPLNLTAIFQGTDPETILLQWLPPATGAIQAYNIFRSVSGGQYDRINASPVIGTDYVDPPLPSGALCYAVSAVDSSAQQGPKSNVTCPIPFSTETLQLDTHEASDDGAAGPVTTSQVLDTRHWFLITVQGTASLWPASMWTTPSTVICGRPEKSPQQSSPGVANGWVGADPEILFSVPLPPGGDCGQLESLGYPRHHGRLQVDLGGGFSHREPLGGAPLDPGPSHAYRFLFRGEDARASFRWVEAQTSDDYGLLSIRIEQVQPSDVDLTVEAAAPPSQVLMFPSLPDPFNPTTEIRYALPYDTNVKVEVYDIRGRAIRRLFDGRQTAGYQSVTWNGQRDDGARAPSGMYFARVTTPVGSATERMTLVK